MKQSLCLGCKNEIYNNTPYKGCWYLEKIEMKEFCYVHKDLQPPYKKHHIKKLPICYLGKDYIKISLDKLDEKGFWK